MSLDKCIDQYLADPNVPKDEAHVNAFNKAKELYNKYLQYYDALEASKLAQDTLESTALHAERIALGNAIAQSELQERVLSSKDPFRELAGIFTPKAAVTKRNLYLRESTIFKDFMADLDDVVWKFRRGAFGGTRSGTEKTRQFFKRQRELKELMDDVARELHEPGSAIGKEKDIARQFANTISKTFERARMIYNQFGGNIPYNPKWRLPQPHDVQKMIKMSEDDYVKFMMKDDLLDRSAMLDSVTQLPLNDAELEALLKKVRRNMITDGMDSLEISTAPTNRRSFAKKHLEHRVLIFKDGNAYLQYQKQFGRDDIFDVMLDHLRSMSHDIAAMQILGPSPKSTVDFLTNLTDYVGAQKRLETGTNKFDSATQSTKGFINDMWSVYDGALSQGRDTRSGKWMRNIRTAIPGILLGSTPITAAATDAVTTRLTAKLNGIPQMKAVAGYVKEIMRIKDRKERALVATQLGHVNDAMIASKSQAMERFGIEEFASPAIEFIADSALRFNGLTHITTIGRQYNGMNMQRDFAHWKQSSFYQLPEGKQRSLSRYNIDATDWEIIRSSAAFVHKQSGKPDISYLRSRDIEKVTFSKNDPKFVKYQNDPRPVEDIAQELAYRYSDLILGEIERAVPTVSLGDKTALLGSGRAGNIPGELTRSFGMFKSWPVAFWNLHIDRVLKESETGMQKTLGLVDLGLWMLAAGALSTQLYDISSGKNPRDMTKPSFWLAAAGRSGGLGPIGDIISGLSDPLGGLSGYIGGPVAGLAERLGYIAFGSAKRAIEGKDIDPGTKTLEFLLNNMPYASSWSLKLLYKRLFAEQLLLWANPEYQAKLNKNIGRLAREEQGMWWKYGSTEVESF